MKAAREEAPRLVAHAASVAFITPGRDWREAIPGEAGTVTMDHASRAGKVLFEGEFATLAFERHLRHPVEHVWEALTKPEHLAQWYLTNARLDARLGGSIDYLNVPGQVRITGKILTWQPPRVFEHEFNAEPSKVLPQGEKSVVRWELTPDGDGTRLRLTHRRLTHQTAKTFAGGLHAFLDRLEELLDGVPLTPWGPRTGEVRENYPGRGG